jgi:predicted Zn-dependent protease
LLVAPAELSQAVFGRFGVRNLDGAVAYRKVAAPAAAPERPRPASGPRPPVDPGPRPGVQARPVAAARQAVAGPSPPAERFQEAVAALRSGRAEEALGRLEALAEADPADGRAPLLAARIHLDRLQIDRAAWWAGVACQRTPLWSSAHYLRGLALQEAGKPEEALAALRRCVFLDPASVLGQVALGDLLARLGEPARARSALRAAEALVGDGDPAEALPGHEELTAGRVRDLIAARLAGLDADPEVAR